MKAVGRQRGMCEWEAFAEAAPRLRALLASDRSGALAPFHLLSEPGVTAAEQRACSELWARDRLVSARPERARRAFRFDRARRDKIRIGYLSSDFQDHATALLLVETLEAHDRARFDIRAYSYGADDGRAMRRRLEAAFDSFSDLEHLSDAAAAEAIFADSVDILVDLKGYTLNARTGIMMLHPAPVQVNYLGFPGTMGADICDYIVTDRFMTPSASAADYSESFAYLPNSYQPHGRRAAIGPAPPRAAAGLPATGFVFCSFNQHYKHTPEMFSLWCRLLQLVPDSVLWLIDSDAARGNLRNEAISRGVAPSRLVFAPDMAQPGHLARLQLADLVLDTSPCGAHTTASDALWAGVPVVTCPGGTFASRVAGSLLHAVGLPDLVAADFDGYFDLAATLAADPAKLAGVRARLRRNRAGCALFDVAGYTADLEAVYEAMWARYAAGLAPALLD